MTYRISGLNLTDDKTGAVHVVPVGSDLSALVPATPPPIVVPPVVPPKQPVTISGLALPSLPAGYKEVFVEDFTAAPDFAHKVSPFYTRGPSGAHPLTSWWDASHTVWDTAVGECRLEAYADPAVALAWSAAKGRIVTGGLAFGMAAAGCGPYMRVDAIVRVDPDPALNFAFCVYGHQPPSWPANSEADFAEGTAGSGYVAFNTHWGSSLNPQHANGSPAKVDLGRWTLLTYEVLPGPAGSGPTLQASANGVVYGRFSDVDPTFALPGGRVIFQLERNNTSLAAGRLADTKPRAVHIDAVRQSYLAA